MEWLREFKQAPTCSEKTASQLKGKHSVPPKNGKAVKKKKSKVEVVPPIVPITVATFPC